MSDRTRVSRRGLEFAAMSADLVRHRFNLVDIGGGSSRVPSVPRGPMPLQTMPRAIRPTKWRAPASVFSPRVNRARDLKRPNQSSRRLAARQVVPVDHEMPQPLAHLRVQAHPSLGYRLPQFRPARSCRHWSFPGQSLQDGQQDPIQVGQGILPNTTVRLMWNYRVTVKVRTSIPA